MIEGSRRRSGRRLITEVRRHLIRALYAFLRIAPGRSSGSVDGVPGIVTETPLVLGWAYRRWDPVEAVVVFVDGAPATLATFGEHRPDVATSRGTDAFHGWAARVDLRGKTNAPVVITAAVLTRAGLVEWLNEVILFTDREPTQHAQGEIECGWLTELPARMLAPPTVRQVEGWALSANIPARIEIRVDGGPEMLARPLVAPRRAPMTRLTEPWKPLAGFEIDIDLSEHEPGTRVHLDAAVVGFDETTTRLPQLEVEVIEPLSTAIVGPSVEEIRGQIDAIARLRVPSPRGVTSLLVVTHQLDLGGGQLYMLEVLRHLLLELDIACLVVAMTGGVLREQLEALGAFVYVCGRPEMTSPEQYEAKLLEVSRLVVEHGCNVAFVNSAVSGFGADMTSRLGIPTVWAIHESYSLESFFVAAYGQDGIHPYVRTRVSDALATSAAIVFEADATRQLYAGHGDERRFVTIPYGIPLNEIDAYLEGVDRNELRSAHGMRADDVVVLCMGTYEPRKSQGALALAFAELSDEFPDAVLALVGEVDNPYSRAVRETVEALDLGDCIRLVPVVEDTYAWYAMADAFVTVSDVESLPRSVLEAMAFGLPVLAANVFGLPELIDDGINGLLFPPRDVSVLVQVLRRLLAASRGERSHLGAAAARHVRADYDSRSYARAYRLLLRGLLEDPRALPGDLLGG